MIKEKEFQIKLLEKLAPDTNRIDPKIKIPNTRSIMRANSGFKKNRQKNASRDF